MSPSEKPKRSDAKSRALSFNQLASVTASRLELEALSHRLHSCGPRVVYELLADLVRGRDVGETLADFSRLDPAQYAAVIALLIDGGRA